MSSLPFSGRMGLYADREYSRFVRVVTEPAVEPITVQEAKDWMRETESAQDNVIAVLISAARRFAENRTRRAFVQQTLELGLSEFPYLENIVLPRPPLQSVSWVKYIDVNGVLQTVDPADYQVDTYSEPGRVKPVYGKFWQVTRNDFNAVQVRYVAGYPAVGSPLNYAEGVPASVKQWMKAKVASLYEHRDEIDLADIPRNHFDGLLDELAVSVIC